MAGFRSPRKVLRRLRVLPLAVRRVRSWPRFTANYALGLVGRRPYRFRNGASLRLGRGVDHVPVIEVFLRRDYGELPRGAVVVDLGASIGVFAVYAAVGGEAERVLAYEPLPESFALMEENVRINRGDARVACFNLAVGGAAGVRELSVGGPDLFFPTFHARSGAAGEERLSVRCTTLAEILDSNALARVDVLKVDIEGAEYELLEATPDAYLARIAEIRMETHDLDEERNTGTLRRFLVEHGFEITHESAVSEDTHNLWARRKELATP